jgi:multiple sugar transport system substrate-binding protein
LFLPFLLFLTVCCDGGRKNEQTVTFWQFWPSRHIQPLIDDFESQHPGVRVEMQQLTWASGFEKIVAAAAAGNPPDLCELGSTWVPRFASEGAIAEVSSLIEADREKLRMWEVASFAGGTYGWPWVLGTRVLFYNRALLVRAGLDPDDPPSTWSEMLKAARLIHDRENGLYGFGLNAGERYVSYKKFMAFAWGNGGGILSDDLSRSVFDSLENLEALDFYVRLLPYALLERQDMLDQAFKEGRLGMVVSGGWNLKRIPEEAPSLDYGVALIPRPDRRAGIHGSFAGGEVLVIFERSKQKELAAELARFLIRPRNVVALCREVRSVQPSFIGAEEDPYYASHPLDLVFVKQLETAVSPPGVPEWMEMEEVIDAAVESAIHGKLSPSAALVEADGRLEEILARRRAK